MKQHIDDLLNRYIDNDLSSSELKEFKSLMESDSEILNKLKALEVVDNTLHKMEVTKAPDGFTAKVMAKISETVPSIKVANNKSFFIILSSFIIMLFAGFGASMLFLSPSKIELENFSLSEKMHEFLPSKIPSLNLSVLTDNGLMISAIFACVLIVFGIFIYDSHKNFKKKINGFG
ncbi:MAG: hypothetical protein JEY94_03560 [Melioribacteraceae bacterium]|nr:hypothetical protein [Melioribacteraceae bacterium]